MEFLRAIGPVFNFLLLALALIFFTRKQIRKLFQERRDRIADALGRAADAQDQARHTAEDIAEAKQAADAEAHAQLAEAKAQAERPTPRPPTPRPPVRPRPCAAARSRPRRSCAATWKTA